MTDPASLRAARAGEPAEVVYLLMLREIYALRAAGESEQVLAEIKRSADTLVPMFGQYRRKFEALPWWKRWYREPVMPDYLAIADTYRETPDFAINLQEKNHD